MILVKARIWNYVWAFEVVLPGKLIESFGCIYPFSLFFFGNQDTMGDLKEKKKSCHLSFKKTSKEKRALPPTATISSASFHCLNLT